LYSAAYTNTHFEKVQISKKICENYTTVNKGLIITLSVTNNLFTALVQLLNNKLHLSW